MSHKNTPPLSVYIMYYFRQLYQANVNEVVSFSLKCTLFSQEVSRVC